MIARLNTNRSSTLISAFMIALITLVMRPVKAIAYDSTDVARLSGIVDEAYVLGKGDTDWSYAEPNLIIERGDLLQTNETGMAEIQFDSGLTLRLGESSRAAIVELGDKKVVGIDSGRAYLRITREIPEPQEFMVTFPAGRLTTIGDTLARIDILDGARAQLRVFRGEIALETISEAPGIIRSGESVLINSAGDVERGKYDLARRDDFDAWNEDRDIALSTYRRPEYIEENIIGAEELEGYGEWVYSGRIDRHVWRPYVAIDWKPYYYGRWHYSDISGWTWIPEEPWGYVTHHYGTWEYDPAYGWIWAPGYEWRPARVSWAVYDDYVGWAPVGYYGYPVVATYPYYVIDPFYDYFDFFSITFVRTSHFHHRHGHRRKHGHHDDWNRGDGRHERHDGGGRPDHGDARPPRHDNGERAQRPRDFRSIGIDGNRRAQNRMENREKIRSGAVRFVKNPEELDLQKVRRKGRSALEIFDHEKALDIKKHPELRSKIAKRNGRLERRFGKIRTSSKSAGLPQKVGKDNARRFDFRERIEKRSGANKRITRPQRKGGGVRETIIRKAQTDSPARRSASRRVDKALERRDAAKQNRKTWAEFKKARDRERIEKVRKTAPSKQKTIRRIEITSDDIKQAEARAKRETMRFSTSSIPLARERMREAPSQRPRAVRETFRSGRNEDTRKVTRTQQNPGRSGRAFDRPSRPISQRNVPARVDRSGSSQRVQRPAARSMPRSDGSSAALQEGSFNTAGDRAFSGHRSGRSAKKGSSGARASGEFRGSRERHR